MAPATGLGTNEVRALSAPQRRELYDWHTENAGRDLWLPAAIRRMPLATRIELAASPALTDAWRAREVERVKANVGYFIESYGHVKPPTGDAVPFSLWDAQLDALALLRGHEKVVILKARRLGLTWLVLHDAFHVAAFDPTTPGARIPIICKNLPDANKLLDRVKQINRHLPPYLRQATGKDSARAIELVQRAAEISTLPASPGAARLETATYVVLDEFAFPRNRLAATIWTDVQATIEGEDVTGGRLAVISTGNGRTGDGEAFAAIWDNAVAGRSSNVAHLFLPWQARPGRTSTWRESQREDYLTDEEFEAEYPDNPEQALAGGTSIHVYPLDGIAAAEYLGGELAQSAAYLDLIDEGIELGSDWGDFQTFTLYACGLPGGGLYVIDELVQTHAEPGEAAEAILRHAPAGLVEVKFTHSRADSAPAGTNATFSATLDRFRADEPDRYPETHLRVPFGEFKEGGQKRGGVNTVGYLRRLFKSSAREYLRWDGDVSKLSGCLAVHPRCKTFLAQLRNLERDVDTGRVRKPSLDPRNIDKGDHGPDALVALSAPRAAKFLASRPAGEGEG